jgi:energy-converting hydrogenase Eha subunit C
MAVAPELQFQDFSTVQGPTQPKPGTIASAATIAPVSFLTILTGNVAVVTITPPMPYVHMLAIQFAGTAGVTAAGNIATVTATVAGQILLLVYNPLTAKYVPVG